MNAFRDLILPSRRSSRFVIALAAGFLLLKPAGAAELFKQLLTLTAPHASEAETNKVLEELNRTVSDLQPRVAHAQSPEETIRVLNSYFFEEKGFRLSDLFLPNDLLQSRSGSCLGLSFLYLAVAEKLNLPMVGVETPGHFFVRYEDRIKNVGYEIETTRKGKFKRIRLKNARASLTLNQSLSHFMTNLAAFYIKEGDLKSAEGPVLRALEFDRNNPRAYYNRSIIFLARGEILQAKDDLERSLALDPEDPFALSLMGVALAALGRQQDGERYCVKAIGKDSKEPSFYSNLALAYLLNGEARKADVLIEKGRRVALQ